MGLRLGKQELSEVRGWLEGSIEEVIRLQSLVLYRIIVHGRTTKGK